MNIPLFTAMFLLLLLPVISSVLSPEEVTEVLFIKGALSNYAIFTEKRLWWDLFLVKLYAFRLSTI